MAAHERMFATRRFRRMISQDGGGRGVDDEFVAGGFDSIGA